MKPILSVLVKESEKKMSREEDLNLVREALQGCHGDDALRIAGVGMRIVSTLLRKNKDYGNSAFESPELAPGVTALEGIQTRMSDKVKRLRRLLAGNDAAVQESVVDSIGDLAGYAMLWISLKEKNDGKEIFGVGSASKASSEVSGSVASGGEGSGPASGHG